MKELFLLRVPADTSEGPEATLLLVHVEDVARMLVTLAETSAMSSFIYNTPVEAWEPE
jgi:hypothetical protein